MKELFEKYKIHLIIFIAILAVTSAYLPEAVKGKRLAQSDITQYQGAAREYIAYQKQDERILWTNSQFGGMPTYQISGVGLENPLQKLRIPKKPLIWEKLFLMLFSGYMMFLAFRVKPWLAFIGAIAMSFVTGNMLIMEAGHNTQALAIAYAPLIIGGVKYLLRKKWIMGINLVMIGMALELVVNHFQITYYLGIVIGIWMLYELYAHIKSKDLKTYLMAAGLAVAGVAVAIGANSLNILLTQEYVKHTIRGKSELTIDRTGTQKAVPASDGLEYGYAFQWSNNYDDVMAMFIPNYAGGGANTGLYYGALPFTSGPQYMGIVIAFLAVFGFMMMKGTNKWWLLTAIIIAVIISLGKNYFTGINNFLFDNLPLYNKFRVPTMALTIVQLCLPIMAILGLNEVFSKEIDKAVILKKLKYAGIGFGSILAIISFMGSSFNDYQTTITYDEATNQRVDGDAQIMARYEMTQDQFDRSIVEPRKELVKKDSYRSLGFAVAIFVVLWLSISGTLTLNWSLVLVGAIILADFWGVDKRYLDDDKFKSKRSVNSQVRPTPADQQIMQDKSHYRVLDLTTSPLQDARASYFHKSLGGYSAAKMRRYQELFDWHVNRDLSANNLMNSEYLNMLNAKYFLYKAQQDGPVIPAINQNALGAAWFVPSVKIVDNADSAMMAMRNLKAREFAIIEKRHAENVSTDNFGIDSNATIEVTSYHPEELKYSYNSSVKAFMVFSEIYYADGWNAYIDGEKASHSQTNYILRGLEVPAGDHEVIFKFEPRTYKTGKTMSLISNGIIYLVLFGSLGWGVYRELKK